MRPPWTKRLSPRGSSSDVTIADEYQEAQLHRRQCGTGHTIRYFKSRRRSIPAVHKSGRKIAREQSVKL